MSAGVRCFLSVLPQMFPGVHAIPLERIRSNRGNQGPVITDEMVEELAANIAETGLLNPVKVMPDGADPLAPGVELHEGNPRLRANGKPLTAGDFNYILLSGELRYRAFQKLGRAAIPAQILNPTAEEAVLIRRLDNRVRERGWWADYQAVEALIEANPELSQRQVAVRLELDMEKVGRAIRLLPFLNPEARALIFRHADDPLKGTWRLSETAAAQLAVLGSETDGKPGVGGKEPGEERRLLRPLGTAPAEVQNLVLQALRVALDRRMTECAVLGLAAWIQEGKKPEDYPVAGSSGSTGKGESGAGMALSAIPSALRVSQGAGPNRKAGTLVRPVEEGARPKGSGKRLSGWNEGPFGDGARDGLSLVWEELARRTPFSRSKRGWISVVRPVQSKIKRGEKLHSVDCLVLGVHQTRQVILWLWRRALRPALKLAPQPLRRTLKDKRKAGPKDWAGPKSN